MIANSLVGIIAQRLVRRLCPECKKAKLANETIPIQYKVAAGNAGDCIITASETERCDLIIIGSHGFTGLSRLFAASNSVADRADVPVLIIK